MAFLYIDKPEKIKIEYDIFGHGKPILFLHGGGTDYHSYTALIDRLSKNYQVIGLSVPGFGLSSHISRYTLEHFENSVLELLKYLDIKEVFIIGHSMGGGLALYFSSISDFPIRILGVITVSPLVERMPHRILVLMRKLRKQHEIEPIVPGKKSKRSMRWIVTNPRKWRNTLAEYRLVRFLQKITFGDMFRDIKCKVIAFISENDLVLDPQVQFDKLSQISDIEIIKWEKSGHNTLHHRIDEIISELEHIY